MNKRLFPHCDVNELSLLCAILLCLRDFVFIMIAYQKYWEDLEKKEKS